MYNTQIHTNNINDTITSMKKKYYVCKLLALLSENSM